MSGSLMDPGGLLLVLFLCCSEDFSKVTRFLETLVQNLGVVGLGLVRFALVKCGVEPKIEFYLNTYNDVSSVVSAVKSLSQSPASPGDLTCNIMELRKTIFPTDREDTIDAPDALIVISDRKSPDINHDTVIALCAYVKVFIVAVKEADYSEMNNFMDLDVVYVQNFNSFRNILIKFTQCFCRGSNKVWVSHYTFSVRRARVSWTTVTKVWHVSMCSYHLSRGVQCPGTQRSTELLHLKPNTDYTIKIIAHIWPVFGPRRPHVTSVCAEDFGHTEAEVLCRELDCGGVSELQGALSTEESAVRRSFHCRGTETALKDCESSETLCSTAANVTCTDQWRHVNTADQDLDFGSALCQQLGCGSAFRVSYNIFDSPLWLLEPECVKQRADLRHCVHESNNTHHMKRLYLICSDYFPDLRIWISSEAESESQGHRVLVRSGANFTVSCSLTEPLVLFTFNSVSPTGNYTLRPINQSAHFLFSAIGPAHTGNYTCEPNSHLILRAVIYHVVLITTALFLYCQVRTRTKDQTGLKTYSWD
ncbi:hypothetical protein WMY93_033868 [Mugilogobius chulae]|uniref:Uncharacterized protein n=1 Tax=Mugilogobius chulae TaxID=88201 RepID=A0AAW0MFT3_9GOBI